jgi:mxaJ protein
MCSAFRNRCASKASPIMVLLTLAACAPAPAQVGPQRVLRVCADPNNLPFSNQAGEGFENRLANLVAVDLNARVEYVWWPQRRGFVRNTLAAGTCDVILGVPSSFELAATTRPYYRSSYVFVVRADQPVPESLDDPMLRTKQIGVHLIGDDAANTPPAHALSARRMIDNVRGYSIYGDYRRPNPPAELILAVGRGEIDMAIAWGPTAGYFMQQSATPLRAVPVTPEIDPPFLPFVFDIAMGVRHDDPALLAELDAFVLRRRDVIDRLLAAFHVPRVDRRIRARAALMP